VLDEVAARYWGVDNIPVHIRWGRRPTSGRISTLAQFDWETSTIEVAPHLDSRRCPVYVVKYLVHHELCHWALQHNRHDDQFRALEAYYKQLQRAISWIAHKHDQLFPSGGDDEQG
jgi:hypothetical protein